MKYLSIILLALACMTGCQIRYNYERMPAISTMSKDEAKTFLVQKEAELKALQAQLALDQKHYEDFMEVYKRFGDDWNSTQSRGCDRCRMDISFDMQRISSVEQAIAALKVKLESE